MLVKHPIAMRRVPGSNLVERLFVILFHLAFLAILSPPSASGELPFIFFSFIFSFFFLLSHLLPLSPLFFLSSYLLPLLFLLGRVRAQVRVRVKDSFVASS